MWVKQLIGRLAGTIVEVPFSVAEISIANGTAERATDEEIVAAGFDLRPVAEPVNTEILPPGYRLEPVDVGGFDLLDAAGLRLNEQPYPNIPAVLSAAHDHRALTVLADIPATPLELADLAAIKASFDAYRIEPGEAGFTVYDPAGVAIEGGPFADQEAAELARRQHLAAAHGLTLDEYESLQEAEDDGVTVVQQRDAGPIVVPDDWRELHFRQRKALAERIAGRKVKTIVEADSLIAAHTPGTDAA